MKKKIYSAGAIKCYIDTSNKTIAWRNRAKHEMMNMDHNDAWEIFNPIHYYNYWEPSHKTEKEIMRFFFSQIKKCEVVLVNLKDIEKSFGTSDEILFSYLHEIPVIGFYEDSDDISFVHPWKVEQIDRIETGEDALKNAVKHILEYY